jgi:hypothetical protein
LAIASLEMAGLPRQERVLLDPRPRIPDLIGAELLILTRDRLFHEALGCAVEYLKRLDAHAR